MGPIRLLADNFTPPSRTPWGGEDIYRLYKRGLVSAEWEHRPLGESWEVSVEPSFPSRAESNRRLLSEIVGDAPRHWIGGAAGERRGQPTLLIKLLNSAQDLSLQVHPDFTDANLAPYESGKEEGWIILNAAPNAGIYVGFRDRVTRHEVESCLATGGPLNELMNFVPVRAGEAFLITPGTPHAVGAGITLIEPQALVPGRHGVTYRFWDWNRRYDANGVLDDSGHPRPLHVQRSIDVTRWDAGRGDEFVDSVRCRPSVISDGPLRRECAISASSFFTERWLGRGTGTFTSESFGAVTCVKGSVRIETDSGSVELAAGRSGVVPAAAGVVHVEADGEAYFTREVVGGS